MSEQTTKKRKKANTRKAAEKPAEEKKAQAAPDPEKEAQAAPADPEDTNDSTGADNESAPSDSDAGKNKVESTDADNTAPYEKGWEVDRVLKVTKPLMKGDDVKALQAALIARNYHCGVAGADGVYARNTAYAVRCFQSANRLVVDGKAGRYTVTALGGTWKG